MLDFEMNRENETYHFCIESIKFAYNIIGYHAILKELNFIHHINNNISIPTVKSVDNNETETETEIETIINSKQSCVKQIYIENDNNKNKYMRKNVADDFRCKAEINKGARCTFKRGEESEFCSRHAK